MNKLYVKGKLKYRTRPRPEDTGLQKASKDSRLPNVRHGFNGKSKKKKKKRTPAKANPHTKKTGKGGRPIRNPNVICAGLDLNRGLTAKEKPRPCLVAKVGVSGGRPQHKASEERKISDSLGSRADGGWGRPQSTDQRRGSWSEKGRKAGNQNEYFWGFQWIAKKSRGSLTETIT